MSEIDRAIMILREKYEEGKRLRFVRDPISWALYQTWKVIGWKEKRHGTDGEDQE